MSVTGNADNHDPLVTADYSPNLARR